MQIVEFTPWSALVGGVLIGAATALVLGLNGRIAGISGVVARIFRGTPGDRAWRIDFTLGLIAGGALAFALLPETARFRLEAGLVWMTAAGLLVGLGTRIGGGCTSGHGVCGIGRGSRRSLVATLTFMAVAIAVVWVVRHLLGGGA